MPSDSIMIQFEGVHGTSVSKAESIQRVGFRIGRRGYRGSGVYFWEDGMFARDLAIWWHHFATTSEKQYIHDEKKNCAVISAKISVSEDEVIQQSDILEQIKSDYSKDTIIEIKKEQLSKLYDALIDQMEKILGTTIKVLITTVTLPKFVHKGSKYNIYALGLPVTYVVRDITKIDVTGIEVLS